MNRRKLLFLISEDWFFTLHFLPLAREIAQRGYQVAVATQVNEHGDVIQKAGLDLYPLKLGRAKLDPLGALRELASIEHLYRQIAPDVVHQIALKPIVLGTRAARRARIPAIVNMLTGLGYVFAERTRKARAVRAIVEPMLRHALAAPRSRVIVQHQGDAGDIARFGLAGATPVHILPGVGIAPKEFEIPPPPAGVPLVILPARLLRHKGIGEFVAAARILKSDGIVARFALVGAPDPSNPASLTEAEIDAIRSEGAVEVWGWRNDMARVLEEATIVCLPSYYREGLPKSLLEAAAARRAIVTTDMPGCRDIVLGGKAGWLVPPRDAFELSAALMSAIMDPPGRQRRAANAYDHALETYSLRAITDATLAIYDELLAAPRMRPRD